MMTRSSMPESDTLIISSECSYLLFMKSGTDLWAFFALDVEQRPELTACR